MTRMSRISKTLSTVISIKKKKNVKVVAIYESDLLHQTEKYIYLFIFDIVIKLNLISLLFLLCVPVCLEHFLSEYWRFLVD